MSELNIQFLQGFDVKLTPMGRAVPLHFAINLVPHLNGNRYIPILYEDALNQKYKKEKRTAKDAKNAKKEVKRVWRSLRNKWYYAKLNT
ncbi:MAG: hypothetical protein V7K98_04680 [Nostoc sp.]